MTLTPVTFEEMHKILEEDAIQVKKDWDIVLEIIAKAIVLELLDKEEKESKLKKNLKEI